LTPSENLSRSPQSIAGALPAAATAAAARRYAATARRAFRSLPFARRPHLLTGTVAGRHVTQFGTRESK